MEDASPEISPDKSSQKSKEVKCEGCKQLMMETLMQTTSIFPKYTFYCTGSDCPRKGMLIVLIDQKIE